MIFLQIVPFLLMLALYAAYLKAAGRLLKFTGISWRRCFGLAFIIGCITIAVRAAIMFGHVSIPPMIVILLSLAGHVGLGSYTFRSHGSTATGNALQARHGGLLSAVALGFMVSTAGAIFGVLHVLRP